MTAWLFALAGWWLWLRGTRIRPLAFDRQRELRATVVGLVRAAILVGALLQLRYTLTG